MGHRDVCPPFRWIGPGALPIFRPKLYDSDVGTAIVGKKHRASARGH